MPPTCFASASPSPRHQRSSLAHFSGCACLVLGAWGMLGAAPAAQAATAKKETAASAAPQKAKKSSLKIKNHRSRSEETAQERDKRLTRECKGAPNAGGCLGYAKP